MSALHDITLFVEVARTLSFSEASRRLGVSVATISRRIAALEKEVGVRLLNRTTRRVELTDTGRRHFERCSQIAEEALMAQAALRDLSKQPKGRIRLAMPVDLGVQVVAPWLADFAQQFPDITFDVDLSSQRLDRPVGKDDLVLQLGEPTDDQVIARRIGALEMRLYAAPGYLQLHGRPQHPHDLSGHDCITRNSPEIGTRWQFERGDEAVEVQVHGRFTSNSQGFARALMERGRGIGVVPTVLLRDGVSAARLECVLPDWSMARLPVHAVMASRSQVLRVRLLLDFLTDRMGRL